MPHLIGVLGGKGGVGKSTFAVNYAIATAVDTKTKVCLLDMDPRACGDMAMLLGIRPKRTLMELGSYDGRVDASALATYVSPHPSGVFYIPSVLDPDQLATFDPNQVQKAIQHLMQSFNVLVVDLGSDLDACGAKALESSSLIYVVTMPEVIVLHHTRRIIEKVQNLLFPMEMIKVVLNRISASRGITPPMIQGNLKKTILAVIPDSL